MRSLDFIKGLPDCGTGLFRLLMDQCFGRVLDYTGRANRKMCSLYLSLMEKAGVRLDRFGDSNERLAEI